MKAGYIAELQARKNEFEDHKLKLEGLYMNNDQEDVIEKDPNLKAQFEEAVKSVDKLLPTFATTLKSVKMAVETRPIMEKFNISLDQAGIFPPYLHMYVCDHFGMSIYGLHSNPSFFCEFRIHGVSVDAWISSACTYILSKSCHTCYCKEPPKPKPKGKSKAKAKAKQ